MPLPAAHAATGTTLYVNNAAAANCSDATADSSVTPYCTIQAAVDAVAPGETVLIAAGFYHPFTVTTSGTANLPIAIKGPGSAAWGSSTRVVATGSDAGISVTGASFVEISDLAVRAQAGSDVTVAGSDHITVDSMAIWHAATVPQIEVESSSHVTISRNNVTGASGVRAPIISVTNGTAETITTNYVGGGFFSSDSGIALDNVTASAITSNDIVPWCGYGISVADGSTSTAIENNIVTQLNGPRLATCPASTSSSPDVPLYVDSASVSGTSADYNDVTASGDTHLTYSWAGNTYGTASAFAAATSQGTHDSNSLTYSSGGLFPIYSAAIDSADAAAPGEFGTDIFGNPRVDDPLVDNSGAGPVAYYDRGVEEYMDPITATYLPTASSAPEGSTIGFSSTVTDPWSGTDTCTFDFGDGSPIVSLPAAGGTCNSSHLYSAIGSYRPTLTVTNSYEASYSTYAGLQIVAPAPLTPTVTASAVRGLGVVLDASGTTDSWNITDYTLDFGDGTKVDNGTAATLSHAYWQPGTYTITVTVTDAAGNIATRSVQFTTAGSYYTPMNPVRVLDTRKGIGVAAAKVPAFGTVSLKIAGVAGVPLTGARAVALNVTVVNPAQGGYLTAYPGDQPEPTASNVNFTPGKTVPNMVIVQVGSNGYVNLTNGSGGTLDLVADLAGFYSASSSDSFGALLSKRLLDTRTSKSPIPANGVARVYVGSYSGATAVTLNVTVTHPEQGGYVTAYPDGGSRPVVSNLNFAPGQTVPNEVIVKVGADGYADFANGSAGSTDLVVDIEGYFVSGKGAAFTPISPTRVLDTRQGSTGPLAGGGMTDLRLGNGSGALPALLENAAIAGNLTVTNPTAGGYLTAWPDDSSGPPRTSLVNFSPKQTIANAATVALGGTPPLTGMDIFNGSAGPANVILDVFGYYSTN